MGWEGKRRDSFLFYSYFGGAGDRGRHDPCSAPQKTTTPLLLPLASSAAHPTNTSPRLQEQGHWRQVIRATTRALNSISPGSEQGAWIGLSSASILHGACSCSGLRRLEGSQVTQCHLLLQLQEAEVGWAEGQGHQCTVRLGW